MRKRYMGPILLTLPVSILSLTGPAIEVVVGPYDATQRTWVLPKALLSYHSFFFRAACEHDFKERLENRVTLPEDIPEIFGLFVQWMYSEDCDIIKHCNYEDGVYNGVRAWVLGDKLRVRGFKNFALRQLHKLLIPLDGNEPLCHIEPIEIRYAYNNTLPESELQRFFLLATAAYWDCGHDKIKYLIKSEDWEDLWEEHRDFRNDLLRNLLSSREVRLARLRRVMGDFEIENKDVRS
ncbi:hypothetical protein AOQ84DRAFT_403051 [Glonium stellatum]|uniref:BTB domain-containing protein n=1 Tax=Glonium stellatum TaxID=574774 RepID=A0A8E2JLS3_9PEZI|nr:hypothetical protein AOQ84DRAFT_403051 [Glonium stellatum]